MSLSGSDFNPLNRFGVDEYARTSRNTGLTETTRVEPIRIRASSTGKDAPAGRGQELKPELSPPHRTYTLNAETVDVPAIPGRVVDLSA